MRKQWLAASAIVALAAVAGCGSASTSSQKVAAKPAATVTPSQPASTPASSPTQSPTTVAAPAGVVKTRFTTIGTVLTNAKGRTLYWFALDSSAKSHCSGGCAQYWPPVAGPLKAGSGVSLPRKFGTITRSNGFVQATYAGHPLYTYVGDSFAGDTAGNGVTADGGPWWAMTPSGAKPAQPAPVSQPPAATSAPAPPPSSQPAPPASSPAGGGGYGY
jgi:predicted lipoprotein with Yx(FWY)xxD motif